MHRECQRSVERLSEAQVYEYLSIVIFWREFKVESVSKISNAGAGSSGGSGQPKKSTLAPTVGMDGHSSNAIQVNKR